MRYVMLEIKPQKVLHLYLEEKKKKPNFLGDYIISEKVDGIYAYVDYDPLNGYSRIHSRAGRPIPAFEKQAKFFDDIIVAGLPAHRLIMEAYIPGKDFYTANGIFNRSIGDYHCDEVHFALHDIIIEGYPKPAIDRYNFLLMAVKPLYEHIVVHPILGVSPDKEVWMHYAEKVWEKDGEGVVLKAAGEIYYPDKRNSSLMKIKLESKFNLLCVEMFYTEGEKGFSNINIVCRRRSGALVTVRLAKHSDIALIEEDKNSFLGKVVTLKCMCEITKGGLLREPRFITINSKVKPEDMTDEELK